MLDLLPALSALIAPSLPVFSALLLGHVLADFVFQNSWMVRRKRNVFVLLLHITIVFATTTLALGGVWQVAIPIAFAHLIIDMVKCYLLPARLRQSLSAFLLDQLAHLATLIAAALMWVAALSNGVFAGQEAVVTPIFLILAGLVLCVLAGGHAVALLSARFAAAIRNDEIAQDSLPDAGRIIGQLERALIFLLIFIGQPAGIGFLIAAKSVLRFDTAAHQKAGEYVIIGTLASFTWALVTGYATLALLEIAASIP